MISALTNEAGQHVSLWQDYLSTQFDPAHILSELGFSLVFELIQLVFIAYFWKRVIKPRLHAEVDEDHGIVHHRDHIHLEGHEGENSDIVVMTRDFAYPRLKSRRNH
jgi:hypothetical protein